MQENAHNVARLNDYRGRHKETGCYSPRKTLKSFRIASELPTGFRSAHLLQAFRLFYLKGDPAQMLTLKFFFPHLLAAN